MRYRQLGASGLRASVLTTGTMTFGGRGGFASIGSTGVEEGRRQVDRRLEAGVNLLDTANVCSDGLAEEIFQASRHQPAIGGFRLSPHALRPRPRVVVAPGRPAPVEAGARSTAR